MLKKEQLLSAKEPFEPHIFMTVGVDRSGTEHGFNAVAPTFGRIDKCPYWTIPGLASYKLVRLITEHTDRPFTFADFVTVTGEGVPEHSKKLTLLIKLSTGDMIEGFECGWDEFSTGALYGSMYSELIRKEYLDKTIGIEFIPPLLDIYKKVKQVFIRSQKEGVVNAWEGNAYRVGYTRKGKYHQRHGLHCTGDPRWKFSLDYTSWQDRKGQRTYRGCGISIFPRLGWKLTRACHHEHIEKYITHWLYRFPSKAPNGRLIRKYLLNLGVTSQLEVPYAA